MADAVCPQCQESVAPTARVCPYCRHSTLCDVVVTAAMTDARARYQAARTLSQREPGGPTLAALQEALGGAGRTLVRGTLPGAAQAWAAALTENGVACSIQPASATSAASARDGGLPAGLVKVAAGAAALLLVGGIWLLTRRAPAAAPGAAPLAAVVPAAAPALSSADIAQHALPSTVAIVCPSSIGTGFFVAPDRILTNAHVVCAEGETIKVRTSDGREGTATRVKADERLDLAVLQPDGISEPALPLGDAGSLRVGDRIMAVGTPKGLAFSVTQGGVSNLDRFDMGVAYVQIDAPVNPGNSGGPLLDERGRVVGVVSLKRMDAEGLSFALPINYAFAGTDPLVTPPGHPPRPSAVSPIAPPPRTTARPPSWPPPGSDQGLVGAEVRTGGVVLAKILWPTSPAPIDRNFQFTMAREGRSCALGGTVDRWIKAERPDGQSILPPRTKAWLEQHGFSSDMYAGIAVVDASSCLEYLAPGTVLQMADADGDASSLTF